MPVTTKYEHMAGARVYKVINGRVHMFCGVPGCGIPVDITWGEHTGHIGRLIFAGNKKLGQRMANGQIDGRPVICFPKTKRVTMCPACAEKLATIATTTPAGRTPFIEVEDV
jgi:hypothetical protein